MMLELNSKCFNSSLPTPNKIQTPWPTSILGSSSDYLFIILTIYLLTEHENFSVTNPKDMEICNLP